MKEVRYFYKDLYKSRTTNPNYDEIINALGPGAIKLLSQAELQYTERQMTIEEHSNCLKKTKNNTKPGGVVLPAASIKCTEVS